MPDLPRFAPAHQSLSYMPWACRKVRVEWSGRHLARIGPTTVQVDDGLVWAQDNALRTWPIRLVTPKNSTTPRWYEAEVAGAWFRIPTPH